MLALDLARATALGVLAFMVGDAFGDWINDSPEYWALSLGMLVFVPGLMVAAHRDEMRAYKMEA